MKEPQYFINDHNVDRLHMRSHQLYPAGDRLPTSYVAVSASVCRPECTCYNPAQVCNCMAPTGDRRGAWVSFLRWTDNVSHLLSDKQLSE